MIPVGYVAKSVTARPKWMKAEAVDDICSVSGCIAKYFADYIPFWRHNGYWLFNTPEEIVQLAQDESIVLSDMTFFYFEAHERQFDEDTRLWSTFVADASFATDVHAPQDAQLLGYDVTTFTCGNAPECSPLSCNDLAAEIPVNRHCLFDQFDDAVQALERGMFDNCEPGPFRILAVYRLGQTVGRTDRTTWTDASRRQSLIEPPGQ